MNNKALSPPRQKQNDNEMSPIVSPAGVIDAFQDEVDYNLPIFPDFGAEEHKHQVDKKIGVRFSEICVVINSEWAREDLEDVWWSRQDIIDFTLPAFPDFGAGENQHKVDKKGVRFSELCVVINSKCTQEDLKDVWWSRQDITNFQSQAKQKARGYRVEYASYIQALTSFFKQSKRGGNTQKMLKSKGAQELIWLSPSSCRGLEVRLHKIFGQRRTEHVYRVLQLQQQTTLSCDMDQKLYLISRHTSRPSRILARLMALRDAAGNEL